MKIPSESNKWDMQESGKGPKGDVNRELVETSDIINTFIVPARINKKNGLERLHKAPSKDPYKGYFAKAKVKREPAAGDTHLVSRRTFRSIEKYWRH